MKIIRHDNLLEGFRQMRDAPKSRDWLLFVDDYQDRSERACSDPDRPSYLPGIGQTHKPYSLPWLFIVSVIRRRVFSPSTGTLEIHIQWS